MNEEQCEGCPAYQIITVTSTGPKEVETLIGYEEALALRDKFSNRAQSPIRTRLNKEGSSIYIFELRCAQLYGIGCSREATSEIADRQVSVVSIGECMMR